MDFGHCGHPFALSTGVPFRLPSLADPQGQDNHEKTYYRCSAADRQEKQAHSRTAPAFICALNLPFTEDWRDEDPAPGDCFFAQSDRSGLSDTLDGGKKLIVIHLCQRLKPRAQQNAFFHLAPMFVATFLERGYFPVLLLGNRIAVAHHLDFT